MRRDVRLGHRGRRPTTTRVTWSSPPFVLSTSRNPPWVNTFRTSRARSGSVSIRSHPFERSHAGASSTVRRTNPSPSSLWSVSVWTGSHSRISSGRSWIVLARDVRRVHRDHVDLPAERRRDLREEVAGHEVRVAARGASRSGGRAPSHRPRGRCRRRSSRGTSSATDERHRAQAGRQIHVDRRLPLAQPPDRLLGQELRGVARDEHPRHHLQLQPAELGVPRDQRDRLAGRAPVDRRLEASPRPRRRSSRRDRARRRPSRTRAAPRPRCALDPSANDRSRRRLSAFAWRSRRASGPSSTAHVPGALGTLAPCPPRRTRSPPRARRRGRAQAAKPRARSARPRRRRSS